MITIAFTQLKNVIRTGWSKRDAGGICASDKNYFVSQLIELNYKINAIQDDKLSYRLRKLIKDIIELTKTDSMYIYK